MKMLKTRLKVDVMVVKAWFKRILARIKGKKMDDKFEKCMQFVFDREGRIYENNPADPGGETKFGISKKSYPELDIKNLTEERAKEIYLRDYWNPFNCDALEQRKALAVFDTAVNQGKGMAQEILGEFNGNSFTVEQFLFKRLRHYSNLIQSNPARYEKWCHTWMLRVIKVFEYRF